jgi:hypothetical protein
MIALFSMKCIAPPSRKSLRRRDCRWAEVSKLPNNTHLARRALYDRRWVAVAARLQGLNLDQITSEQLAFQKAICKVEIEMAMYEVEGHAKQQPMPQEKRRPF